jgi:glycosyltransferase involved in cell wall biosynthesis
MKVLLTAPCLGAFGGIEAFCLRLAKHLTEEERFEVKLAFRKVNDFQLKDSLRDAMTASPCETTIQNGRPRELSPLVRWADLVHGHNPSISPVFLAKRWGKPCVLTIYNWRRPGLSLRSLLWRLANKRADRNWYISEFVWKSWEPRAHRSTSDRLPVVSDLPEGIVSSEERFGFFFISRWIPNKGLRLLLDAYKAADLDRQAWPLRVAGDGPLRVEILRKIEQDDIQGVEVLGFVSEEQRKELTRRAKWMVTPPNTNEDLGLTPLEARNVGVPCIVTNDGGLVETGGKDALRSEPGDLAGLVCSLETAARMSETEYLERSRRTKEELNDYLQPLDRYAEEYRKLLHTSQR